MDSGIGGVRRNARASASLSASGYESEVKGVAPYLVSSLRQSSSSSSLLPISSKNKGGDLAPLSPPTPSPSASLTSDSRFFSYLESTWACSLFGREARRRRRKKTAMAKPRERTSEAPSGLGTIGALSLSVVSSVSIVIANKALISTLHFKFATTLTSWHLMVTFLSLYVAKNLGFFEHKPIDRFRVVSFGICNGISIGFLNLSLGFNSVGFYQMTKLAIIPFTVLLETTVYGKYFSRNVKLSLLMLLMGVGVATVTDFELNFLGTVLSILAIVTTCGAQITTSTTQKLYQISSTQLLYQSCPYMAGTLLISGPFVDKALTGESVFRFDYTIPVVACILLTCFISVLVNFSTFMVIGKTSPVTYQVLGHLKTCLVLTAGFMFFNAPAVLRNIFGILVAIVGMILYSYVSLKEGAASKKPEPAGSSDVKTLDMQMMDANGDDDGDESALLLAKDGKESV